MVTFSLLSDNVSVTSFRFDWMGLIMGATIYVIVWYRLQCSLTSKGNAFDNTCLLPLER